jgi:hypothetical protein
LTLFIKHRCVGFWDRGSLPESDSTSSLLHLGRIVPAKHFLTGLITGEAKSENPILWSRKEKIWTLVRPLKNFMPLNKWKGVIRTYARLICCCSNCPSVAKLILYYVQQSRRLLASVGKRHSVPCIHRSTPIDPIKMLFNSLHTFAPGSSEICIGISQRSTCKKNRGCSPQANWPSGRRLSAKLVPTFAGRGCCVVSTTNSNSR